MTREHLLWGDQESQCSYESLEKKSGENSAKNDN